MQLTPAVAQCTLSPGSVSDVPLPPSRSKGSAFHLRNSPSSTGIGFTEQHGHQRGMLTRRL